MNGFVDEILIEVSSGKGGNGTISFRREKYSPNGGPDGGDGGKGGDVIFVVKDNLKTLSHLKRQRVYKAENGAPGGRKQKSGKKGADIFIFVPPGAIIKDPVYNTSIKDFGKTGEKWVFLRGGVGGKGNMHFATSIRQAPRIAKPGRPARSRHVLVELNLIADVGLVGLPNAGKSTLLSIITNANPRIASYPFTTTIPNLGVLHFFDRDIVIADIPGIINGASSGAGLGFQFLKHISRTKLLIFLVDLNDPIFLKVPQILEREVEQYAPALAEKESLLLGTKLDITGSERNLDKLREKYPGKTICGISAVTGRGLNEFKSMIMKMSKEEPCGQ